VARRLLGDRYRLDEQLGRGGMATVWRGWDTQLDQPVAVKVLDRARAADPVALKRLQREASTVARLNHPNIVGFRGFAVDADVPYLVMELVDGESVTDLLVKGGPLPVDEAVAIAQQACAALATAHEAGVIHRDVTPGNLLVGPDGVVKMCDFGIARLQVRGGLVGLTSGGAPVGTCEFMAPEQATGGGVDTRCDLYALGCVLFAMLAGGPPFAADNPMAVLHKHLNQPPASLRTLRADVPPELDQLVADLLAKDPTDRPASAGVVGQRLAAVVGPVSEQQTVEFSAGTAAAVAADPVTRELAKGADGAVGGRHRTEPVSGWLQRWGIAAGAGLLILATVVAVVVVLTRGPGDPGDSAAAPGPQATAPVPEDTSASPAVTATSSPATPSSPPPTRSRPGGPSPAQRVAAFAEAVQRQVDAGQLDTRAGRDLLRQLRDITSRLQRGDTTKAVDRLAQVENQLDQLRRNGQLSAAGFAALAGLDAIIRSITGG
jgi:serine/threonine-protein kinase